MIVVDVYSSGAKGASKQASSAGVNAWASSSYAAREFVSVCVINATCYVAAEPRPVSVADFNSDEVSMRLQ